jgi:tRNA-Thr(GGU) m(6)t(6)A37 methyltransferase TsaA
MKERAMFEVEAIGTVCGGRAAPEDDFWGGSVTTIELAPGIPSDSLAGIDEFSHLEIVYVFDRVDPSRIVTGARHPRNNLEWPLAGIFAQRGKNRPNRIGCTIVRLREHHERSIVVEGLDAIDGTPVLDIKPVFAEYLPEGPVEQPDWSHEIMRDYWASGAQADR